MIGTTRLRIGATLAVAVVGLFATVPAPASAEPVLDANCPGPETIAFPSGVDHRWAETFTALNTGSLVRGETEIAKTGAAGDFVMQILATDSAGDPTNNVLASTTIPDSTVPTGSSRIAGIFSTPASVIAGERYAFMITRPGEEFTVRDAGNNPCPDGAEYLSTSQTAAWSGADTCCDLLFAVYVEPPLPSNQFTLGKLKRNLAKGTAKLMVKVPGPGTLTLRGKGLVRRRRTVSAAGAVKLLLKAKGSKQKKLNATGRVRVKPRITFTPTGGGARTKTKKVVLKKLVG